MVRARNALMAAVAALGVMVLASCSGDTGADPSPTPGASVPTDPAAPAPDPDGAAGFDVCATLSTDDLHAALAGTWSVQDQDASSCTWQEAATFQAVTVTVYPRATYDTEAGRDTVVALSAGAGGMLGFEDADAGLFTAVWAPVGMDWAVGVSQSPLRIEDMAMIALAETVAIALENAPAPQVQPEEPAAPTGDLLAIDVFATVDAEPSTVALYLSQDDVEAAADASVVFIGCSTGAGSDGVFEVIAYDTRITFGTAYFRLVADAEVGGPGSYNGEVSFQQAGYEPITGPATLQVGEGLISGVFASSDSHTGREFSGTWQCLAG